MRIHIRHARGLSAIEYMELRTHLRMAVRIHIEKNFESQWQNVNLEFLLFSRGNPTQTQGKLNWSEGVFGLYIIVQNGKYRIMARAALNCSECPRFQRQEHGNYPCGKLRRHRWYYKSWALTNGIHRLEIVSRKRIKSTVTIVPQIKINHWIQCATMHQLMCAQIYDRRAVIHELSLHKTQQNRLFLGNHTDSIHSNNVILSCVWRTNGMVSRRGIRAHDRSSHTIFNDDDLTQHFTV